jgi:hypothetical protein
LPARKRRCRLAITVAAAFLVDQSEALAHELSRPAGLSPSASNKPISLAAKKLFCRHKPGGNLHDGTGCDIDHVAHFTLCLLLADPT